MGLVIYSNAGGDGDLLLAKPSLPCKSISAKEKDKAVHLTWEDPDSPEDTTLYSEWASTRIVRKEGGFPVDGNDGVIVVTSTTKNEYKDTAYVDSGLINGTTYYYRAFTCSVDSVYNLTDIVQDSATPRPFKVMTVQIDLNDSNPKTCGSYIGDALDMPSGKTSEATTAWQEFFGYRPCLFKDGQVVGYLNPKNYSKFENGDPADITSGDAGDVMVEFPRRGIKISKSGKIVTISMSENPEDEDFTYYAHNRGDAKKEYFYLGAYIGSWAYGTEKLRSLSNESPGDGKTIGEYREYSHMNGDGYEQMTWWQWIYLQIMYVLQFKGNLNSQSTIGVGCGYHMAYASTGKLDTKGLFYGTSDEFELVKAFGIECLWGNSVFLEGLMMDSNYNIYIATDNFNDDHKNYSKINNVEPVDGFIDDIYGTAELGFLPISTEGSGTTYFCDGSEIVSDGTVPTTEYFSAQEIYAGIFATSIIDDTSTFGTDSLYARLSYY